jgi:lipopolysaccharide export system protein LptC
MEHRKIFIALILIAIAMGSWWLTHNTVSPLPLTDPRARHEPDYIVENFLSTAMNEIGTRKYQLRAERLTHYPDDDTSHLIQPELTQYVDGAVRAIARADTGLIPGHGREIIMKGNVRVRHLGSSEVPGGETSADQMRFQLNR